MTFAFCEKEGIVGVTGLELLGVSTVDGVTGPDVIGESWEHVIVLDDFLDGSLGDSFWWSLESLWRGTWSSCCYFRSKDW